MKRYVPLALSATVTPAFAHEGHLHAAPVDSLNAAMVIAVATVAAAIWLISRFLRARAI